MEQNHNSLEPHRLVKKPELRAFKVLEKSRANIKRIWEMKVREQIPAAHSKNSLVMLNSLDTFLSELVFILKQDPDSHKILSEKGMSKTHGKHRAAIQGYFLPQLLKEFSILREVINNELNEYGVLTFEVRSQIDKAIDAAISLAATEFTSVQQASTKAALAKAEMSNRDLEQFAGVAAHDLKSPLATISGYLNLLEEELEKTPDSPEIEYIDLMQKASLRMRNLIDRLLEYARLTKTERPFQAVDLNEVVKISLENLSNSIQESRAEISYDPLPTVMGDENLLNQVFQNLFANALKFRRDENPHIHVSIDPNKIPDMWLVGVADNGIGFDPKDKENIFALYTKLHAEEKYKGSGIGLATCRKVIELHGGQIWAESTPGKGSTFFFTLPKN